MISKTAIKEIPEKDLIDLRKRIDHELNRRSTARLVHMAIGTEVITLTGGFGSFEGGIHLRFVGILKQDGVPDYWEFKNENETGYYLIKREDLAEKVKVKVRGR